MQTFLPYLNNIFSSFKFTMGGMATIAIVSNDKPLTISFVSVNEMTCMTHKQEYHWKKKEQSDKTDNSFYNYYLA